MEQCRQRVDVVTYPQLDAIESPAIHAEGVVLTIDGSNVTESRQIASVDVTEMQTHPNNVPTNEEGAPMCRICFSEESPDQLQTPCNCTGSMRYVHQLCLLQWLEYKIEQSGSDSVSQLHCEVCKTQYRVRTIFSLTKQKVYKAFPAGSVVFLSICAVIGLNVAYFFATAGIISSHIAMGLDTTIEVVYVVLIIFAGVLLLISSIYGLFSLSSMLFKMCTTRKHRFLNADETV